MSEAGDIDPQLKQHLEEIGVIYQQPFAVINNTEREFRKGLLTKKEAAEGVIKNLVPVMRSQKQERERQARLKLQEQHGKDIYILPTDQSVFIRADSKKRAYVLPPFGDLLVAASSLYDGCMIVQQPVVTAPNLQRTIEMILERRNRGVVQTFFGSDSHPVDDLFGDEVLLDSLRGGISATTAGYIEGITERLQDPNYEPPEIAKPTDLLATGMSYWSPEWLQHEGVKIVARGNDNNPAVPFTPKFKDLGKSLGIIYGGVNDPEYSVPTTYSFGQAAAK